MKRLLQPWVLLLFFILGSSELKAQNMLYRDTFIQSATYCPTGTYAYKWAKYKNFRAGLDTTTKYFTEVRMWGEVAQTNSVNSRTCTDRTVINQLANALKNGTAYVGVCNGYKWEVSAAGNCNNGSCSAPTSEVVHFATYPSSQSSGVCLCADNDYWVIRTTIQNANKGGVMIGTSGTTCNPATQWIELEFKVKPPILLDVQTVGIQQPDLCTNKQDIKARFRNVGKNTFDSFSYWLSINSTITGPFKAKVKLDPNKDTLWTVSAGYTYTPATNYNIFVWTKLPNNKLDSFALNDTAKVSFRFAGTRGVPDGKDTSVCGSQSLTLRAVPANPADSLAWYADRAMTQMIARGKFYKTPYLPSGVKYKYYVSSYSDFQKGSLALGYTLTNGWPSCMYDLKTTGSDLTIDSIGLNIYDVNFSVGTSLDVEVYMREGSWSDPGATTTPSMWKKIYTGPVISRGSQKRSTLFCSFDLKGGKTYGIYINPTQTGSNTILAKPASSVIQNGDIILSGGTLNQINFGTALSGYTIDGELFYKKLLCKSAPDSVIADVKPAPYGAKLSAGVPFQTSPKKSGSGAKGLPHVVAKGDTLALELQPPVGYANNNHNSTWKVKSVVVKTITGRTVTGYTWVDPNAGTGAPGRLVYTPDAGDIDSQLIAYVSMQDLGPHFCDSVLNHYIYVAPLPEPKFSRNTKVCEGDVLEFTNTSTIMSGFLDYKWYFGDGDSSDAVEPIHEYPGSGTYYCKLNAISSIYGYVRTKIDTIVVTKLPVVDFKVVNACERQTHRFINNTSATGTVTYKWNFGTAPGVQSTVKDPTYKYTTPGQYKVTLTAEANGCPATLTKNAYLFPKPKANFSFPSAPGTKFCSNVAVPFTNLSTVSSGTTGQTWSFGDGELATVTNPNHKFTGGGNFNVRLISITPFGCADTATKPITIGSAPAVAWSNGQVCDQTPTQFTNATPAIAGFTASPVWSFGDGAISGSDNPLHQYSTLGPKEVKLVVSVNNGCKDSLSKSLTVGIQAVADFAAANTCSGKPVPFENKSTCKQGTMTYEWDFGDGNTSTTADPIHTYTTSSSFAPTVKLKVTVDGACETIVTKPLQVYELPNCAFTITDDWTPGEGYRTIRVQAANTTYPFYRFKFSDGGSINASSGVYQFPYEGDFTVQMFARNSADCECNVSQVKSIRNSMGSVKLEAGQVRMFPNPSNGLVNVEAGSQIQRVEVYNMLGEQVVVNALNKGQMASFRFGEVSNGVYLVKVITAEGTVTQRITLNR